MKNGMYKYKHAHLNDEVYVKAFRNKLTLHRLDSVNGSILGFDYVGRIDEDKLKRDYLFIEEVKQNVKWNLEYWVSGRKQATLIRNGAFGVCHARKIELRRTTHKSGLLTIVRAEG